MCLSLCALHMSEKPFAVPPPRNPRTDPPAGSDTISEEGARSGGSSVWSEEGEGKVQEVVYSDKGIRGSASRYKHAGSESGSIGGVQGEESTKAKAPEQTVEGSVEGYFHLHPYLELWQQRLRQPQSEE